MDLKKPINCVPYMGSKRKLARRIVDEIISRHGEIEHFYDLFGGGGAISFAALERPEIKNVHYNEIDTAICDLLIDIRDNGIRPDYYNWVSRNEFNELKNGTDWKVGLVKTCWSFGNNYKKGYLFGAYIEEYKKAYHEVVVDDINRLPYMESYAKKYVKDKYGIECELTLNMPDSKEVQIRRLEIRKQLTNFESKCRAIQDGMSKGAFEQLEQLQHLEQLQRLQKPEFTIHNKSYDKVEIEPGAVVYLDPPYKNTAKYQNDIDHDELDTWIKNSDSPVYVSSYEWPSLAEIASFNHMSTLSPTNNSKRVEEKLFSNIDTPKEDLFFIKDFI